MGYRAPAWWISLFLFSVYLLTFSGKLHVMDEFVGFAAGNNWVQHGRPDVNQFIWTNHWHSTPPGIWGQDGNLYTKKAPGISLAAAPLIWLGHTLPNLNAIHTSLLTINILAALTGGLLFIWLADLKLPRLVAGLTALAYGLCTIALVYARLLWEHAIIALLFLVAIWAVHRAIYNPLSRYRWAWVFLCSAVMAISLTMRFEAAMAVALFGLYIFFYATPLPQKLWLKTFMLAKRRWGWSAIYLVLPTLTTLYLFYFNFARFGRAGETGYNREILFEKPWVGTFGLLFSPSTGLFIYVPLMLLLFGGIGPAWRRLPRPYFWLIVVLSLFYWVFYGSWFSWGSTWVWGPRFMLHTLPLLMLFVAETVNLLIDKSKQQASNWIWKAALGGVGLLALLGFVINFLGVIVDLNEHFLRLGRNDNFVFNWAAFPPIGHWQILQEGLVDFMWLRPQPEGLTLDLMIFIPALLLFTLSMAGLIITFLSINRPKEASTLFWDHPLVYIVVLVCSTFLVYQMMLGTSKAALATEQTQIDSPVLSKLAQSAHPTDMLLIPMPPFGDVQEIAEVVMAYIDRSLPTYIWIESEPRAIQAVERERLWQVMQNEADYVWLFERWLTADAPLGPTAALYNQEAFLIEEEWFEQSGKLTLYTLADENQPVQAIPLNTPFQGGVTAVEVAVFGDTFAAGEILKVRLIWQASDIETIGEEGVSTEKIIAFVHLLDQAASKNIAQYDRLLLNLDQLEQSPLLPGQVVAQGYGLQLPADMAAGSYPLIIGGYSASNGQRLLRADDNPDDFLYVTNIVIRGND